MSTDNLTDLEICKRIAEIEGAFKVQDDGANVLAIFKVGYGVFSYESSIHGYNPLTDDALLMQLIKKYISKYRYDVLISPEDEVEIHYFTSFHGSEVGGAIYERTALIAIIEAHNG